MLSFPKQHLPPDVSTASPAIRITNLVKSFVRRGRQKEKVVPVDHVTLTVGFDELTVLLGPSGCGKTTLLRCVAGLEKPESGEIEIDGRIVFSSEKGIYLPPEQRDINMIFQSYALWPHMTIFENVAYPLRSRPGRVGDLRARVMEVLDMVGLADLSAQHPSQISGGQQQRVALARSIVGRQKVILFDEPLSNVDAKVREQLRVELLSVKRQLGFSALYVTHDQAEAMSLGDRIAVLSSGKVMQNDTPRRIYHEPANEYVGRFVGTANIIGGTVKETSQDLVTVATEIGEVTLKASSADGDPPAVGADVKVLSRPEAWSLSAREPQGPNVWQVTVVAAMFAGPQTEYVVRAGETEVRVMSPDSNLAVADDVVWAQVHPGAIRALPSS